MAIHVRDYTLAIMTMKLLGEIYIISKDFHKAISILEQIINTAREDDDFLNILVAYR